MVKKFDIESYALDNLERPRVTSTNQVTAVCPWCGKYGAFYIDIVTGHYICFKCEEKGRYLIGVIAQVEDITWQEAKRFFLRKAIQFRRKETLDSLVEKIRSLSEGESKERILVEEKLPSEFIPVYKGGKWKFPSYLKNRKIKRETAKAWGLGFCNRGMYWKRIIIPIDCPNGYSFTARDTTGEQPNPYRNPPGVDHGKLLIGWNMTNTNGDITLVEGPMDAIKLWQHGIPAMALGGKYLHFDQIEMLLKCPTDIAITIMLDPEEMVAPYGVAKQLIFRFEQVHIATLPQGVDPGSSTQKQAWKAYDESVLYEGGKEKQLKNKLAKSRSRLDELWR
jgi:DNA primase